MDPMKISPNYDVEDWKRIDFSTETDWQDAINILWDRLNGRFLEPIALMKGHGFAGFAVMALDSLLIESLQQFREGEPETPYKKGEEYFIQFLTKSSFGRFFNEKMAKMFYRQIRNGILHQAETKETSLIHRRGTDLVKLTDDGTGISINRDLFHEQLVQVIRDYIEELRNPVYSDLRISFRKKMDFICRVT
jgi:hypothetical protein